MNKFFFTLLFVFAAIGSLRAQGSGGPDAFGYKWYSDSVAGGRPYQWVDISTTGTLVTGLTDDNYKGPFPIGFSFRYYWMDYTQFYVGSNGYISFGGSGNIASTSSGFPILPTSGGALNNYIAPAMTDYTFTDANANPIPNAQVRYQTMGDSLIVSFLHMAYWTDENTQEYRGDNNFQIVLNRADSSVTINYQSFSSGSNGVDGNYIGNGITFMSRGMENVTGAIGLTFPNNVYPAAGTTIYADYPDTAGVQVKDMAAEWVFNSDNGGIFSSKDGQKLPITAAIRNTGTQVITDTVTVFMSVFNGQQLLVPGSRDTLKVPGPIAVGETKVITFNKLFNDNTAGAFSARIQIKSLFVGEYYNNNTIENEFNVVDTTTTSDIILCYADTVFTLPSAGGADGVISLAAGQYFESPFYPSELKSVSFGLLPLNLTKRNDFIANIYDDNFNLIYTQTVTGANVQLDLTTGLPKYNEVTLPNPYTLTPGAGVYVSIQLVVVDSVYNPLATDGNAPFSRRTYEITGGQWAPYRSMLAEDFLIRAHLKPLATKVDKNTNNIFGLGQNYPNPAENSTVIPFALAQTAPVELVVRDITGKLIETKTLGMMPAGQHTVELNTFNYSSGVYTYTLQSGSFQKTSKMIIQK